MRRFLEKPSPDEITCDTINAGIYVLEPDTFDRIPKDTPYSIERGYFPSLVERNETFVAYVERGYWIDIGTPEKYVDVHRDIFDGRCPLGPAGIAAGQPVVAADARVEDGAVLEGPCFVDAARSIKAGARVGAASVIGRGVVVEEGAQVSGAIVWPNTRIGRDAIVDGAIIGRSCHVGREARRRRHGHPRRQDRAHRLHPGLIQADRPAMINPDDLQGVRRAGPLPRGDSPRTCSCSSAAPSARSSGRGGSPSRATCGCRRRR